MAASICPRCGSRWNDGADLACRDCGARLRRDWRAWFRGGSRSDAVAPPEAGVDALWARVALVGTVVVTVAMAAMVLVMTIRGMHLPH